MTLLVNEQVLRFQISVSDVHTMQVVKGKKDFTGEEKSDVIRESAFTPQQREKFTTTCVVKKHVDMRWSLEVAFQIDNEWVVYDW